MKVKSRILSLALALAMLISLLQTFAFATGGAYSDTSGHWAENAIEKWSERGVLTGYGGLFRPDDPLTRAEMAALLDRVMKYQSTDCAEFADVCPDAWYYDNVRHLAAAGVIMRVGDGFAPNRSITREEAAAMTARAFGIADGTGEDAFTDAAQISGWAAGAVRGLKDAGYIDGYSDGGFHPKDSVTRAEVVTILDNMIGTFITAPGEYDFAEADSADGFVVINTAGVTLKNMQVNGDLLIAAGVGDGEVHLDNVEVSGSVRVEGGGENSVYFNNCTIKELIVTKTHVRVALENGCVVEFALSLTGDSVFEIGSDTEIGTLTIIGEGVTVKMSDGASIQTLNADAGGTAVEMAEGTSVGTANLNGETKISGGGTIQTANVNISGCEIETEPETLLVKDDVAVTINSQDVPTASAPSQPQAPPPASGDGGSTAPVFTTHSAPNKPNTPYGTAFGELGLPATVTLYATGGARCTASVTWDDIEYIPTAVGAQTITGAVTGANLPSWAPAAINVTVTVLPQASAATLVIKGENTMAAPSTEIVKGGATRSQR